jgi:hypothetical protein
VQGNKFELMEVVTTEAGIEFRVLIYRGGGGGGEAAFPLPTRKQNGVAYSQLIEN